MTEFVHLHNHTEFSLLDGAARIEDLITKACNCGMHSVAITDHGNMFGVPKFVQKAKSAGLKAIIGCEFYVTALPVANQTKENRRFHQILLAKNEEGYKNLVKLCSLGYTDGYYYKPRVDKETLKKFSSGLIASTCCLASEINQTTMKAGPEAAEKTLKWYLDVFGEDYYIEIQRHGLADQEKCNTELLKWAKKYGIKVIATNDVHYVEKEDSEAHDLLLALQTASDFNDTTRFRFVDDNDEVNPEFYFKSPDEMSALFHDIPDAIANTLEVAGKCKELDLNSELILPNFRVPPEFSDMDSYLAHLTMSGVERRYPGRPQDVMERIQSELDIIRKMGFAGYFLVVQSFTTEARKRGVFVGPGRGSAAGSVVAYCLGIIDVDPIRYSLLFERFMNPERISPPDIDIDFDDEGRQEVINYVIEQYGRDSVSQVITYGTMGAKTAVRDVGRTLGVPLTEVNRIAKLIPERPGITFQSALDPETNPDFARALEAEFQSKDAKISRMMKYARTLEGTARHTGVHACAVIIAPGVITDYVPVSIAKDKTIVTQYDGPNAELCGLLKMDFLGLKTLSIIKTAIGLVSETKGITIDPDQIPMDDTLTFELYQRGDTVATFQFESDGMRKYLRQLKPTTMEDLIAMNALYRPGPMDNIPNFVRRKNGLDKVEFQHPILEPILKNTYGIMVYQEQIMQAARDMAGYSLGQADLLRRAMGKKKMDVMQKEREKFIQGAAQNQIPAEKAEEIFNTMEKFAQYGFNKSHAAAYSVLAFKTAWFKAHYPEEYMAAVLTHSVNDITKITFFVEECRRMGISVLPPSVNESLRLFRVNEKRQIRFGLEAIKGVGRGPCEAIIAERNKNGKFKDIFELTSRVPGNNSNKRVLEALAYAGALDDFGLTDRSAYFALIDQNSNTIERAMAYGARKHAERNAQQRSLFESAGGDTKGAEGIPNIPATEPWSLMERLNHEKEVIGFYLSAHPLDDYRLQIEAKTNCGVAQVDEFWNKDVRIAGIVVKSRTGMTKKGTSYASFVLEDYTGTLEIPLFGDDFAKFAGYIGQYSMVLISGSMKPSFRDPNAFELRVTDMKFIEEAFEKMSSRLVLEVGLDRINPGLIQTIETLFLAHQGNCDVEFKVVDAGSPISVKLPSRKIRVSPSPELMKQLQTIEVTWSLS